MELLFRQRTILMGPAPTYGNYYFLQSSFYCMKNLVSSIGWFTKTKFKLETRAPSQFVRPVNSIIEIKLQHLIPAGRWCSMTLKYYHNYSSISGKSRCRITWSIT